MDISKTFRYRYYEFIDSESGNNNINNNSNNSTIDVNSNGNNDNNKNEIIMKLYRPLLETENILKSFSYDLPEDYLPDIYRDFEYLNGCDIIWEKKSDCYYGRLINDECKLCSLTNPDLELVIKDELKLWKNELWINDRVYTTTGKQIIGNKDGIPYKMKKLKKYVKTFHI